MVHKSLKKWPKHTKLITLASKRARTFLSVFLACMYFDSKVTKIILVYDEVTFLTDVAYTTFYNMKNGGECVGPSPSNDPKIRSELL